MKPGVRIAVRNIRAYGRHGLARGEQERVQPFDVDVELDVGVERARTSDALADTVDYAMVHRLVLEIVAETSFALLERLGWHIAEELFRDERVLAVRVTIAKPRLLDDATPFVSVSVDRKQT